MSLPRSVTAFVLCAAASSVQAGLPDELSGSWYNPAQSGHGISIEFVGSSRAVVIWHVYDPAGRPLTLYLDGQVRGRAISGPVYAPAGMRFGVFDPTTVRLPAWGSASLDFTACDAAELAWQATDPAYGQGRMPMVPLVARSPACVLPPPNALPAGLISGRSDSAPGAPVVSFQGIVDGEGRLWGIERSRNPGGESLVPGPAWLASTWPSVLRAIPVAGAGVALDVEAVSFGAFAFSGQRFLSHEALAGSWVPIGEPLLTLGAVNGSTAQPQSWTLAAPAGVSLVAPLTLPALAGNWDVRLRAQFFALEFPLSIAADGSACLSFSGTGCDFSGRLEVGDGAIGLVDFELVDHTRPHLLPYRGRGWLADTASGRELVLVGDNGSVGLGLIARPR